MADFEIMGPYIVAILMGMGAVSIFIWGVLAGAFHNTDQASQRFFRTEMENDRIHKAHGPAGK